VFVTLWMTTHLFAQDTGTVEGHVVNSATGNGIPAVPVEIRNPQGDFYHATTDAAGAFHMAGVKYGTYGSTVTQTGYDRGDDTLNGGIRVYRQEAVQFDIKMVPWTTLRGRVLDPDGEPAPKVRVQLSLFGGPLGFKYGDVLTDEHGSFSLQKLPPGSYLLLAKPEPVGQTGEGARTESVPTYYPSGIEPAQADRIYIRGGIDPPDYEIRLRTSPVYRIRGVVLDDAGKPAPHAAVHLMRPGGHGLQSYVWSKDYIVAGPEGATQEMEVLSGADGRFEFPSVRRGEWRVEAELDPKLDPIEREYVEPSGGVTVTATGHDVDDLEIRLALPFDLEYSVDWGTTQAPESERDGAGLMLRPMDGQPFGPPGEPGSFKDLLPGRYRIVPLASSFPGLYVASVLLAGREVLGQEVDLEPGSAPLRIVYKAGAGILRGTVEKGQATTIVLLPQSSQPPREWSLIRALRCRPDGTFEFGSVEPGDYYAWAFDRVDTRALLDPAIVASLLSSAATLKVQEGSTVSVELRAVHWPL
jgi:hypothetical protein